MRKLLLIGCLFIAGCGASKTESTKIQNNSGIMGGVDVEANDPISKGMVGILNTVEGGVCTGSIIAEDIILTAAHCVVGSKPAHFKIIFHINLDWVSSAREPDVTKEHSRSVSDIIFHEKYDDEVNYEKETDWHDIALMKIRGTLPEGYAPVKMLKDDSELKRGQMLVASGYGVNEVELVEINPKKYPKLELAIEQGYVICEENLEKCFEVNMHGEGTLRRASAPVSSYQETEFRLEEFKQGTCAGDSGGPVFLQKNDEYFLYGITSRGGGLCDDYGIYTNVVAFQGWILENIPKLKAANSKK